MDTHVTIAGNLTDDPELRFTAQAEHAAESLTKGARVLVCGRLRQRSWETDDGDKRAVVEIEADEIAASLKFHTATLTKATRARTGDAVYDAAPAEASA